MMWCDMIRTTYSNNIYYDYFSEQTMFYIVLSFEQTIEQCTCIVLFYLLSDDLVEQWFTIVLSVEVFAARI